MRLTAKQAAERVGVSRSLIYAWCRAKQLRHFRAGAVAKRGKIVIEEADLAAFMKQIAVEAVPPAAPVSRHFS